MRQAEPLRAGRHSRSWRWLSALALGGLIQLIGPAPLAADETPRTPGNPRTPGTPESTRVSLADFDHLLARLEAGELQQADATVVELVRHLKLHHSHKLQWQQERSESLDFAMGEMAALHADGQIEDALAFGIESHGLATDKQQMLDDPRVSALIEQAVDRAADAADQGDWATALDLYRRLELLYDDPDSIYARKFKHAARHIQVMRVYVPDQLKALYEKRAAERGEQIDPINLGDDTWQQRLEGITPNMLFATLEEAEDRHVSGESYNTLLRGALEALTILLETKGLQAAFPGLANQALTDEFRQAVIDETDAIAAVDGNLSDLEIKRRIDRIFKVNKQTVRLPKRVLVYEMTDGAMSALDDFSSVIWPYDLEQFRRNTKGSFYGVGIQISMSPGDLTVVDLPEDSPAAAAGLRKGDVISRINAVDVSGFSPTYVKWRIRSVADEPMTLSIDRPGEKELMTLVLDQPAHIQVKRPSGKLTVKSPLRGTPAYRAGIIADDLIVAVNGKSTDRWTLDQAVREITGKLGTKVRLGIERKRTNSTFTREIERTEIEIESVKGWRLKADDTWDYYLDRPQKIGYIRLSQFIPQSADEIDAAINQMEEDAGLEALILDLRFNPGGLLNMAVEVTNRFLPRGAIVYTVDADGKQTDAKFARPSRAYPPLPLVVLINRTSASASEIVSGALQDHGRAVIVGTRSYGRGSVQDLFPIGAARARRAHLKLTTQYYLLPEKRRIHRTPDAIEWGIEPDVLVEMTDDQVREALEARQEMDVLHSNDLPVNRAHAADAKAPAAGLVDAEFQNADPHANKAALLDPVRILKDGLDPPLETALLMLKARLAMPHLEMARKPQPVDTP